MNPEKAIYFMREAIKEAENGLRYNHGGPFGAVIVKDSCILSYGHNEVTSSLDPTAHAEIVAIRKACQKLKNFSLKGAYLFTSCQPCPMCLAAIYWARLDGYYYGATKEDAQKAGFDDSIFYQELQKQEIDRLIKPTQLLHKEAAQVFCLWNEKKDKILY